jgi:hypothetical protein
MNKRLSVLIATALAASLQATSMLGADAAGKPPSPASPKKPEKWIGVNVGPTLPGVRPHLKKHLAGLPDNAGLTVFHVMPESPAVIAGLEQYDVLLRADGEPLTGVEKLKEVLSRRNFGTSVRLDIIHEGQPKTVHVLVLERPAGEPALATAGNLGGGPVNVMVLSSDGRGNVSGNAKVKQKLTYTDATGARHELTGDQIAEFHKRMREDEEFRKSVKDQRIEVQSESIHIGTGAAGGAAGSAGATITIQTTTQTDP